MERGVRVRGGNNRFGSPGAAAFIAAFLLAGLWTAGCAGPARETVPERAERPRARRRTPPVPAEAAFVDVYSVGGDDWTPAWDPRPRQRVLPGGIRMASPQPAGARSASPATGGAAAVSREVQGFRIQLANVLDEESAVAIRKRAEALFDSVYVIFHSPNYKVRAGNYLSRSEADQAARRAREAGFRSAWVVPSRVYAPLRPDGVRGRR